MKANINEKEDVVGDESVSVYHQFQHPNLSKDEGDKREDGDAVK